MEWSKKWAHPPTDDLVKAVNERLAEGYTLVGGMSSVKDVKGKYTYLCFQAIARPVKSKPLEQDLLSFT